MKSIISNNLEPFRRSNREAKTENCSPDFTTSAAGDRIEQRDQIDRKNGAP